MRYRLDGRIVRRARKAPFDLAGGTRRSARPLRVARLDPGPHRLVGELRLRGDRVRIFKRASFEVIR